MLLLLASIARLLSLSNGQQATADCAADFLFVVDGSSSVRSEFRPQLDFIEEIVTKLTVRPDAHRVAMIQYSSAKKMRTEFEFDTYLDQDKIEGAIRTLPYMTGITETSRALELAKEVLKGRRSNVPTFIIVVTDGRSRRDPSEAAKALHAIPGAHTYSVGISDNIDIDELQSIATNPDSAYLGEAAAQKLLRAFGPYLDCPKVSTTTVAVTTTTRPVVKVTRAPPTTKTRTTRTTTASTTQRTTRATTKPPTTTVVPTPRPHRERRPQATTTAKAATQRTTKATTTASKTRATKPLQRSTRVTTRPPTTATTTKLLDVPTEPINRGEPPECQFDLLIILDSSGSETRSYGHELEHAVEYVKRLKIGPENARVAMIRYASKQRQYIDFAFDEIYDKAEILKAISTAKFLSGSTRTDLALELATKVIKDDTYGRRIGKVPLFLIVFTDGYTREEKRVGAVSEAMRRHADRTVVIGVTPGNPHYGLLDIIAGGDGKAYTVNRAPSHKEFFEEWKHVTHKCV